MPAYRADGWCGGCRRRWHRCRAGEGLGSGPPNGLPLQRWPSQGQRGILRRRISSTGVGASPQGGKCTGVPDTTCLGSNGGGMLRKLADGRGRRVDRPGNPWLEARHSIDMPPPCVNGTLPRDFLRVFLSTCCAIDLWVVDTPPGAMPHFFEHCHILDSQMSCMPQIED